MNEELKVIISAETDKLKKGVKDAQGQIKGLGGKVKEFSKDFSAEFQKVGDAANTVLMSLGGFALGLGATFLGLASSTAEYRTAQAKLNTAFEVAGGSAKTAKQTYNDLYRVLGDSDVAVEASNHLAKLTTNQQDLSEWTTICQGVYATFGDSLPIEGLTEAANETAKTGSLTGALADALNWAGVSEDAFQEKLDATNSEAEREALIRETLNGLYTDAATAYETNEAALLAQNEAQAKLDASLAAIGEAAAPIMTMLTELGAEILAELTPYIQEFAEKYSPMIQEALSGMGEKIGVILTWIADNWDTILQIGTVILAIVAACSAFSAIMTIVNAVMYASPITWIVAAIVALIAVIALCIVYWDDIKAAAVAAWDWIKEKWTEAAEWFQGVVDGIKEAFENIGTWFSDKFNEAYTATTDAFATIGTWFTAKKQLIVNAFSNVGTFFGDKFTEAKSAIMNKFQPIINWFMTKWTAIKSIFGSVKTFYTNIFSGAVDGIKGIFEPVVTWFSDKWEEIKGFFQVGSIELPKIKLPSFSVSWRSEGWLGSAAQFLGLPGIPSISVSWNAAGGIFDNPTLFGYGSSIQGIGEDGAEAVVPLEKNLGWLDKLAGMLSDRMNNGGTVVLQVDGRTLGEVTCNSINGITKATGSIPLVLV